MPGALTEPDMRIPSKNCLLRCDRFDPHPSDMVELIQPRFRPGGTDLFQPPKHKGRFDHRGRRNHRVVIVSDARGEAPRRLKEFYDTTEG